MELVSVLIRNFNYGCFLPAAVESVVRQSYPRIELILVDDGSSDDSGSIIEQLRGRHENRFERFLTIYMRNNGGRLHALNRAVPLLRGDSTIILDADDWLMPDYAERTSELLRSARAEDAAVAFAYTDCWLVAESGIVLARGRSAPFDRAVLERSSYIPGCAMTVTSAWRDVMPFEERIGNGEKHYRFRKLAQAGFAGRYLPDPLFCYRMHERNASGIGARILRELRERRQESFILSGLWPVAEEAGHADH